MARDHDERPGGGPSDKEPIVAARNGADDGSAVLD
jgi:hypothetical protein